MKNEDESNYVVTGRSVLGLASRVQANSIRDLTERGLQNPSDYILRIEERPDGRFDVIVLKKIN